MSPVIRRALGGAAALALASAFCTQASAAAFYIQEQSVKGLGRAYSGEVADTGAESLWWNPAAIAGINGGELYLGEHTLLIDADVYDRGSSISRPFAPTMPVGGFPADYKPVETGLVPNMDAAWRLNEQWSVGLAVTAPFAFTSAYDLNSFTRYDALKSRLLTLDLQPTLAWRPTHWLDLGVGFDAEYSEAVLSSALPNLSPMLPDGGEVLKGHGWNYGWSAGAQLHPSDTFTIGGSYRSSIRHQLNGSVNLAGLLGPLAASNGRLSAAAVFRTPWMAMLGARWNFAPQWTVNAQVQRTGWSEFNVLTVNTPGGPAVTPEGYHDTTTEGVGLEYAVNPAWALRTGVQYDPTPTSDATRSARVPDADRWLISVGTTVKPSSNVNLDFAWGYIDFNHAHLNNTDVAFAGTPVATTTNLVGDAAAAGMVLSAGARLSF